MSFVPTAEKLMPDLTPERGDRVAGPHAVARGLQRPPRRPHHLQPRRRHAAVQPVAADVERVPPHDVIRIDLDGNVLEGDWPVPPGIPLHLELHKLRPGVQWAMHNHPVYGTVWADMGEVPPA